ncbi:hypothetical protein ILUMI_21655 [Ignelater luminosus]|uniref:Uncharacterized protein n=1 Tax=Ignelater luminosus TaxID=2038154 RepID=A0A8K0CBN2_IGNLU|nr:hypothetical protein ILUMI_21655 [Ignelater luminosus]
MEESDVEDLWIMFKEILLEAAGEYDRRHPSGVPRELTGIVRAGVLHILVRNGRELLDCGNRALPFVACRLTETSSLETVAATETDSNSIPCEEGAPDMILKVLSPALFVPPNIIADSGWSSALVHVVCRAELTGQQVFRVRLFRRSRQPCLLRRSCWTPRMVHWPSRIRNRTCADRRGASPWETQSGHWSCNCGLADLHSTGWGLGETRPQVAATLFELRKESPSTLDDEAASSNGELDGCFPGLRRMRWMSTCPKRPYLRYQWQTRRGQQKRRFGLLPGLGPTNHPGPGWRPSGVFGECSKPLRLQVSQERT